MILDKEKEYVNKKKEKYIMVIGIVEKCMDGEE